MLVGGQGTRLRPLTVTTPKPMLPTAGVPFVAHQLVKARDAGVDHVILSTSYRAEVFADYFGDGSALGLRLTYVTEDTPLGTGGGIRNVAEHLQPGAFLVFNGDILTGVDLGKLLATHRRSRADVTLHLTPVDDPRAFGLVPTDADGNVTAFLEKPSRDEDIVTDMINAGCYVFDRSVVDRIAGGRPVSVEREVFPQLLADGARVVGHVDASYWLDLGTPSAFVQGSCDLVRGAVESHALPGPTGEALVLETGYVAPDATVTGGTTVGAGARVESGAHVDGAVLFDDAVVSAGAVVRASVVGRGAAVGRRTRVSGAVIGDGATVGADCELVDGARVWPDAAIGDAALRFSSDK
ncbi:MAG: sugar phosphate nucleotidyltransferase [Mycobacteriales bacterium]